MEIFEGFELDPKAFNEQTRSLRHVRAFQEKTDEKSVVEALHKAWLDYLETGIRYYDMSISDLRDMEDYPGEAGPIDKFWRSMDALEKKLGSFQRQTYKWRTGVNLYFERPIDVGRLKNDLKTNLKSLEDMMKRLDKAVKDAVKLKGGPVEMMDVKKAHTNLDAMAKAMKTAIAGL